MKASSEHYRAVLAGAPGPSPWYLGESASDLSTSELKLVWDKDAGSRQVELLDDDRRVYALAYLYTYVQRISPTRFVVWFKTEPRDGGEVHFHLYETSSLKPLTEEEKSSARLKKAPFTAATQLLAKHWIRRNQNIGCYAVRFPPEFDGCPELFVLDSNSDPGDRAALNLWTIDVSRQELEVIRQDWFRADEYDVGYQWVTRIARSPETGELVGDGIRIGQFVLSEDGSTFLGWLGAT